MLHSPTVPPFQSVFLIIAVGLALAAPASAAADAADIIGQPVALTVQPPRVELAGSQAMQQLIVTGRYADDSVRDLTPFCQFCPEDGELIEATDGLLLPRRNGSTALLVKTGGKEVRVPVVVRGMDQPQRVSFRQHVIAALNVGGCNSGACHGTPQGRGGFKLSLRGYDPAADYLQLTRDLLGRRTDPVQPEASLILQKALGRIAHEGGKRFAAESVPARLLRTWIEQGLHDDPAELPVLERIEIIPGPRVLRTPARKQQLAVLAHFADGTSRDITRLTVFTSSNEAVATVGSTGLVELHQPGETAILCRYLEQVQAVRLTYLEPKPGFAWTEPPANNYVDQHVFAKLKKLSILPSEPCSDAAFLRRAYLDVCGTLPTPAEARAFLEDTSPDKRARLIDALLQRPEYADFWTLKWADVLRVSRRALQPEGARAFHAWIRNQVEKNTPLDQMVRELLTAEGDTFTNAPANYYRVGRTPQELAETTAQLFCGVRLQCAQCHNHPWERWTQDDYYGFAAFFARVKRTGPAGQAKAAKGAKGTAEIISVEAKGEVTHLRTGQVVAPKFLGDTAPALPADKDRRAAMAEWLTAGANPFFARSAVNRIWYHLHGRGIVDPVDDFRDSNPSANDELLDALAKDFAEKKFDVKHMIRTIMNSRTYQLSARTNDFNRDDTRYFSHAVPRLLTAEQMLDAICAATGVPETYRDMPAGTRAAQLVDGEVNHPFLKTFGQPARQTPCECERETAGSLARALQLVNGPTVTAKVGNTKNRLAQLLSDKQSDEAVARELYLATLSRLPTPDEVKAALAHVGKAPDKRKAWEDVQWALLNTREFLFRH